jgi:glutamyl-tRNA synthetase
MEGESGFLRQALDALPGEPWDAQTWRAWTELLKECSGRRGRTLFQPLRMALTGEDHGPELALLLPLMGRERVASRLRLCILDP